MIISTISRRSGRPRRLSARLLVVVLVALIAPLTAPTGRAATAPQVGTTGADASTGWRQRPPLRYARAGFDVATVAGCILVIGGFRPNPLVFIKAVEARQVQGKGTWSSVTALPTTRANPAVAALDGKAYVFGGVGLDDQVVDVVEKFDSRTGKWSSSPKLPAARGAAGAAALNGLLYVAGGFVGVDGVTASMIAFDPRRGTWTEVAPMPTARTRLKLVAVGRHLYAVGGQTRAEDTLSTVERYDPRTNRWSSVAAMNQDRGLPGIAVIDRGSEHLVVVVGGVQTVKGTITGFLATTEVFDPRTGRWRTLQARLPLARASLGAAVEADGTVLAISGAVNPSGTPFPTAEVLALKVDGHR